MDDADGCAVDVDGVGRLEATDDERHQVAAHHHRVGEADHRASVGGRPFDLGPVRDRGQVVVDVEGDAEDRFELGFVPARERAPTIGRLHLRGGDDLLVAVVVDVGAAVEPAELVVEDAVERDAQTARAGPRTVFAACTISRSVVVVEFPRRVDPVDGARGDVELGGVQHERVGRARRWSRLMSIRPVNVAVSSIGRSRRS